MLNDKYRKALVGIWAISVTVAAFWPHTSTVIIRPVEAASFQLTKPDSGTGIIRVETYGDLWVPSAGTGYSNWYNRYGRGTIANRINWGESWTNSCLAYMSWDAGCYHEDNPQMYEARNYDATCPNGYVAVGITTGEYWGNRYVTIPICQQIRITTS